MLQRRGRNFFLEWQHWLPAAYDNGTQQSDVSEEVRVSRKRDGSEDRPGQGMPKNRGPRIAQACDARQVTRWDAIDPGQRRSNLRSGLPQKPAPASTHLLPPLRADRQRLHAILGDVDECAMVIDAAVSK